MSFVDRPYMGQRMKPLITVLTLGVDDPGRAVGFYRDGLRPAR